MHNRGTVTQSKRTGRSRERVGSRWQTLIRPGPGPIDGALGPRLCHALFLGEVVRVEVARREAEVKAGPGNGAGNGRVHRAVERVR